MSKYLVYQGQSHSIVDGAPIEPIAITAVRFEVGHSIAGVGYNSLRFFDDTSNVVEEFASNCWQRVSLVPGET